MKYIILSAVLVLAVPIIVAAQARPNINDSNVTYQDIIYTDEINGINVLATDTFNSIILKKIEQKKIQAIKHDDYPRVYFRNKDNSRYLKIWGGPDLGYGWFFTIGYTKEKKCSDCGTYLGALKDVDFIVNNDIKLGESIKQVWEKAHLEYFRRFSFNRIEYFYFEKGVKNEVPFTPYKIFYYKFKNDKLIEIGFGYGMIGTNPMLQPE